MLIGRRSSPFVFALAISSMFVLLLSAAAYAGNGGAEAALTKGKLLQELRTEKATNGISRMIKPENICFSADNATMSRLPALSHGTQNADEYAKEDIRSNTRYGNFYTGTLAGLSKEEMISLLGAYYDVFNQTVSHRMSIDNLFTYQDRDFTCGFSYSEKYYQLYFSFSTLEGISRDEGYVPVHVTQEMVANKPGAQIVANMTTYVPFNNTAVFFNELSFPVTIEVTSRNGGISDIIVTLLPNKMQDVLLSPNWTTLENTDYHYKVKE